MKKILTLFVLFFQLSSFGSQASDVPAAPIQRVMTAMNATSTNIFGFPLVEVINQKLFPSQLSLSEKKALYAAIPFYGNSVFDEKLDSAISPYFKRHSNEPDDDIQEKIEELIDQVFWAKETLKPLFDFYYTKDRKENLDLLLKLAKEAVISTANPRLLPMWGARENFVQMVNKTKLLWMTFDDLKPFSQKQLINGKEVTHLNPGAEVNDSQIQSVYKKYGKAKIQSSAEKLVPLSQLGPSFFVVANAGIAAVGNKQADIAKAADSGNFQLYFTGAHFQLFPVVFEGINRQSIDPTKSSTFEIGLFLTLVHELGHLRAFPHVSQRLSAQAYFDASQSERLKIYDEYLDSFTSCYLGFTDKKLGLIKLDEALSDAIAFWSFEYLSRKYGLSLSTENKKISFLETLGKSQNVDPLGPHPTVDQRKRIYSGQCRAENIPGYIRIRTEGSGI